MYVSIAKKKFEPRDLNLDHVHPKDKGGETNWENVVTSCIKCNTRKGNKLPRESGMQPFKKPVAPKWRPLVGFKKGTDNNYHKSWSFFLDPNSSSVELSS